VALREVIDRETALTTPIRFKPVLYVPLALLHGSLILRLL